MHGGTRLACGRAITKRPRRRRGPVEGMLALPRGFKRPRDAGRGGEAGLAEETGVDAAGSLTQYGGRTATPSATHA